MKRGGFTLLELLVTLAIVGILTAIAWPGYGAVMRRAQRDEARLALLAATQQVLRNGLAMLGVSAPERM